MIGSITTYLLATGRLLPTLSIGGLGGALAYWLHLPLPWLLGALIATTVCSLAGAQLRSPGGSRKAVLVVIGVMLGSAFTPDMSGDIARWSASFAIMLAATASMMAFSVWFGRRVAGYSMETAMYAGVPGGVSAITLMAAETQADLRAVGVTHAVRILVLLVAIPPVLNLIGHVDLQSNSSVDLSQWRSIPALDDAVLLTVAGMLGMWLGRWLHLPNPLLFGPVILSGALHMTGITDAAMPPLIVALAQIIIGVSVGTRFGGVPLLTIGHNLLMAVLQALALLVIALAAAWVGHLLTGYFQAAALLAYMPGGAPELSLIALSLNIDPAFVTSHHLLRLILLVLLLPVLLNLFRRLPSS
ncbi:AbrB family transcriptional regulator [Halomonas sp. M20]|uniref:AbrB family transcriptional regulator n=1 Tax=Halomonas sp. M20 TaxID=2763264 RepID=UPI001D0BC997|nr:AbrB family transcriptional regulator [Halomonas sp. M20]